MIATIHIANVIAELRANPGKEYTIQYIISQGKKRGQIKTITGMYSTGISSSPIKKSAQPRHKVIWKKNGTIPFFNTETKRLNTLAISHMRQFDNYLIKH